MVGYLFIGGGQAVNLADAGGAGQTRLNHVAERQLLHLGAS